MTVETLEQAWLDQAGAAPMTPVMAFGPDGLTLGAGTVLATVEDLEAAEAPGGLDEARLFALLSAAYRQAVEPQALRYIRRGAVSWRAGDKAMAAMHLAMTGLMTLRDMKGAARRLFMADALMKAGTEPDVILRALALPGGVGEDALTRYDSNEPRNPAGSGGVSGRWTREGAAVTPQPSAKPVGSDAAGGRGLPAKPAPAKPAAAASPATRPSTIRPQSVVPVRTKPGRTPPPSAPVKAPPLGAKGPAAIAAEEGAALLENSETFAALASLALRFSGPTVFFSVLLIPSNRTTPDKIPIPGHPDMHLERRIGDRLWTFVYKDQAGVQRHVLQGDDGLIRTVEGRIVGRIDLRNDTVVLLAAVNDNGESEHEPKLCPAAEPDRPGQGPTGTARDYENRVKAVVNKPPTPNAVAYYLLNPDSRDGRVSFDDCQQQTGIMIEAKGPGYEPILKEAEARLAKNNQDKLGRNVIDDLIRQGVLQVDAARISKNRPIVWFCHSQDMIDIIKGRFQKYKKGLENINFFPIALMETIIMNIYNYEGHCRWAGNEKTPQKIGETLIDMFEFLSKIYVKPPGCEGEFWIVADIDNNYRPALLSKYTENFTDYIKSAICIYEGEPDPMGGYRIYSSIGLNPQHMQEGGILNCYLCDGSPVTNSNVNYFEFEVGDSTFPPDPDRVTYSFYRDALLGGISIWAADWAYVRCSLYGSSPAEACGDPTFPYSGFHMPWMCYLSAERAAKVRAPAGIATERTPDGGLLMTAAETRLDPQNPEHMERSKALAELLIEHIGDR